MQSIRTNNAIEGWHHSLNRRAAGRCGLHFFMFVALLHREARLVSLQIDHFTVVCLVTWPLNGSEAGVDLVLIETSLLLLRKFLLN